MSDVLYIAQLAQRLGKTDAAVRAGLQRKADWVPPSFKMGSRHAWRPADVDRFLAAKAKKAGR